MRKKLSTIVLSVQELQTQLKGKRTIIKVQEDQIDYSDIPKFSKKELLKFKRVGRPILGDSPRKSISIRIEEVVLEKIKDKAKKQGRSYQNLINEILKKAV